MCPTHQPRKKRENRACGAAAPPQHNKKIKTCFISFLGMRAELSHSQPTYAKNLFFYKKNFVWPLQGHPFFFFFFFSPPTHDREDWRQFSLFFFHLPSIFPGSSRITNRPAGRVIRFLDSCGSGREVVSRDGYPVRVRKMFLKSHG